MSIIAEECLETRARAALNLLHFIHVECVGAESLQAFKNPRALNLEGLIFGDRY